MHYVCIPEPVTLINIQTGEPMMEEVQVANGARIPTDKPRKPVTLFQLICDIGFSDAASFGSGWKAAMAMKAIIDNFQKALPGTYASIEDDHLERLRKSLLEERDHGVMCDPRVLYQVTSLLRAIKDALTEDEYKNALAKSRP